MRTSAVVGSPRNPLSHIAASASRWPARQANQSPSQTDAEGRPLQVTGTCDKVPVPSVPGRAGYGYEILMLTNGRAEWPISFLQWAVNDELVDDAGLLDRVERHAGLTVEEIEISTGGPINVIIRKARAPLPGPVQPPNG